MSINARKYARKARTAKKVRMNAPYNKISGRGGYKLQRAKSYLINNYRKPYRYPGVGATVGRYIGQTLGGPAGGQIGQVLGQGAHALTKTITGFGDYQVKKNALVYNVDAVPEFSNDKRCTIVTHREMICDIQGSTNFSSQVFRINPAIATTFPWLSSIAGNYEQYVIQGLVFEFKSTSAYALSSSNAALGTVIMATQYNSLSPAFRPRPPKPNAS
jgi:hypothetical protein